jgi:hypothetical protein
MKSDDIVSDIIYREYNSEGEACHKILTLNGIVGISEENLKRLYGSPEY